MRFEVKVSLFISPQFLSSLVQAIKNVGYCRVFDLIR